jgi:hypothetical protein
MRKKRRQVAGREESSFCEQKEAKKLFVLPCVDAGAHMLAHDGTKVEKVFCFFFSKKKTLACLPLAFGFRSDVV